MKKTIIFALLLCLAVWMPETVLAADEVTFTADTTLELSGYTITIKSGSLVDAMSVTATTATFTLSANSYLRLRSDEGRGFFTTPVVSNICGSTYSEIIVNTNSIGSSLVVEMADSICTVSSTGTGSSSGGGGGGGGTTVTTSTTTAETTATTTATTTETTAETTATEETADTGTGITALFDGDLIRNPNAGGAAQFDIYIVKIMNGKKFKRAILSPHVFTSYGHFDKNQNGSPWDDVVDVNQATIDLYAVSDLVRAVGGVKVYKLSAGVGSDTGDKQWMNLAADAFAAQYDADAVYSVNDTDLNSYALGANIGAASTGSTVYIKADTLRVRSSAALTGNVLASVKKGETYALLEEKNGWYKIMVGGVAGWCYSGETGGYAELQ